MDQVISFVREKNGDKVLAFVNLSKELIMVQFDTSFDKGIYKKLFTAEEKTVSETFIITMEPWEYLVLVKN